MQLQRVLGILGPTDIGPLMKLLLEFKMTNTIKIEHATFDQLRQLFLRHKIRNGKKVAFHYADASSRFA